MAPEIILGKGYGKGSDWFSVGCVLYDMTTGAPPFPTRNSNYLSVFFEQNDKKKKKTKKTLFLVQEQINLQ